MKFVFAYFLFAEVSFLVWMSLLFISFAWVIDFLLLTGGLPVFMSIFVTILVFIFRFTFILFTTLFLIIFHSLKFFFLLRGYFFFWFLYLTLFFNFIFLYFFLLFLNFKCTKRIFLFLNNFDLIIFTLLLFFFFFDGFCFCWSIKLIFKFCQLLFLGISKFRIINVFLTFFKK